jgi:hypothetical protein
VAARGGPRGGGGSARQRAPKARPPVEVVFRVAGSPRIGFGHVVRALHLARALGVAPCVSIRGTLAGGETARRLGAVLLPTTIAAVLRLRPRLLVIDDPSRTAALPWLRAARRHGVAVVSIHDGGIAPLASDLAIDGSLGARRGPDLGRSADVCRLGPSFAVLAPGLSGRRPIARPARPMLVIGLGGGRHAAAGLAIARSLRAGLDRSPGMSRARVLLSLGLASRVPVRLPAGIEGVAPARFRATLGRAAVAIVAGGITLYEACALGTPVVAAPVVAGQALTVGRFARAGLAVAPRRRATGVGSDAWGRALSAAALELLTDASRREGMARRGRATFDGHGTTRVADAIVRLLDTMPADAERRRTRRG